MRGVMKSSNSLFWFCVPFRRNKYPSSGMLPSTGVLSSLTNSWLC